MAVAADAPGPTGRPLSSGGGDARLRARPLPGAIGALQPLAPIIAEQLHMSPQAMSLTVGMANAGYAILATAARENSRACPAARARAGTCLRQEEALTAGGSGRFLLKPQAESRREDRSPVSAPRPRFPAGRGMRERRSAPAGSSGSQAGAA